MAKESSLKNMVITLFAVTLTCSAIMGGAYILTQESIAMAELAKVNMAIAEVTPDFDNNPSEEMIKHAVSEGDTLILYPAKKDGILVGAAVLTTTNKGFSGKITMMVGFLPDGIIHNTAVISHAETPGLGDKIVKSKGTALQLWKYVFPNLGGEGKKEFSVQFEGKHPETFNMSVKQDGGEVDAITASTITSRAFCDAVERAYRAFCVELQGSSAALDGTNGATANQYNE